MPQLERNDDVFVLDLGDTENRINPSWSAEVPGLLERVDVASVLSRILTLPVPTVAAIGGHAYAAGGLLALAHDYRFFCLPEIDLRLAFSAGMSALVEAKVTPAAARDLMITGRRYGGPDAEAAAIVDAAVPSDEVIPRALAMASTLAPKADPVMGKIKVGMYRDVYRALRHES